MHREVPFPPLLNHPAVPNFSEEKEVRLGGEEQMLLAWKHALH